MRYCNDLYLEHSLSSSVRSKISQALSGRVIKNHKYYQRVNLGKDKNGRNKYRYFYTKAEYDAYKKKEGHKVTGKDTDKDPGKTFKLFSSHSRHYVQDEHNYDAYNTIYHEDGVLLKLGKSIVDTILGIGYVKPYSIDARWKGLDLNIAPPSPTWNNPNVFYDEIKKPKVHKKAVPEDVKFGKDKNYSTDKAYKYYSRITLPNGKYRYFYSKREYNAYLESSKKLNKAGIHRQEYQYSDKEQVSNVNPKFNVNDSATYNNCWACATAYDLRNKGYDVQANTGDRTGANPRAIEEQYYKVDKFGFKSPPDTKTILNSNNNLWQDFEIECKEQGKGSSGIICEYYYGGGGHALNYRYTDTGEIEIIDPQINYIYRGDEAKAYFSGPEHSAGSVTDIYVIRTDNTVVNADKLLSTDPDKSKDMVPVIPSDDFDRDNDRYTIEKEATQTPDGSTDYKYKVVDQYNPSIKVNLIN